MNFLEQLVAEWYEFLGFFVRTNARGPTPSAGGFTELDVLVLKATEKELIHIETSGSAESWESLKKRTIKKFRYSQKDYEKLSGIKGVRVLKQAIMGLSYNPRWSDEELREEGIKVIPNQRFINEVCNGILERVPRGRIVPDSFPILKAFHVCLLFYKGKEVSK